MKFDNFNQRCKIVIWVAISHCFIASAAAYCKNPIDTVLIKGIVKLEDRVTGVFSSVAIKGKQQKAISDSTGRFQILHPSGEKEITLEIISLGMESREINIHITHQKEINLGEIILVTQATDQDMVVVVKRNWFLQFRRKITRLFQEH